MGIVKFLIAISLLNVSLVSCSRILVLFYHHGASHFYSYYPLFDELAKRGHNVTVVSYAHVKNTHQNYNEILLGDMPLINATITYDTMVRSNPRKIYFIVSPQRIERIFLVVTS